MWCQLLVILCCLYCCKSSTLKPALNENEEVIGEGRVKKTVNFPADLNENEEVIGEGRVKKTVNFPADLNENEEVIVEGRVKKTVNFPADLNENEEVIGEGRVKKTVNFPANLNENEEVIVEGRVKKTINFPADLNENEEVIGEARVKKTVNDKMLNLIQTAECVLPNGKSGECKPIYECPRDEFKQGNTVLLEYLCVMGKLAIGVCCPVEQTSLSQKLAGDLPAVASASETAESYMMKIVTAANRGCGVSTREHGRVIGASSTKPSEWPWMAFVAPEGYVQHCGGVLITDRHVLTAAHCTRRYQAKELFVRLGEYDYDRDNDTRTYNFRVAEKREHEFYDPTTHYNDIAVLKMERAAVFNTYVWPICLPPPGMDLVNQTAVVIGWGTLFFGGPNANVLMEVSVPVWEQQKCVDSFVERVFDENICAAGYDGGKDACQGDSGGPLMYQMPSGRWTAIGIVSWGLRCGEPTHPGVYTRLDRYLSWIMRNALF